MLIWYDSGLFLIFTWSLFIFLTAHDYEHTCVCGSDFYLFIYSCIFSCMILCLPFHYASHFVAFCYAVYLILHTDCLMCVLKHGEGEPQTNCDLWDPIFNFIKENVHNKFFCYTPCFHSPLFIRPHMIWAWHNISLICIVTVLTEQGIWKNMLITKIWKHFINKIL